MPYRAVLFDVGGVVVGSPLHAIAAYERQQGIPVGTINRVVVSTAPFNRLRSRGRETFLTLDHQLRFD